MLLSSLLFQLTGTQSIGAQYKLKLSQLQTDESDVRRKILRLLSPSQITSEVVKWFSSCKKIKKKLNLKDDV